MKNNFLENISTQWLEDEEAYKPPFYWQCKFLNRRALIWQRAHSSPVHYPSILSSILNELPNLNRNWIEIEDWTHAPPKDSDVWHMNTFCKQVSHSVLLGKIIPRENDTFSAKLEISFSRFSFFFQNTFVKIMSICPTTTLKSFYFSCLPLPISWPVDWETPLSNYSVPLFILRKDSPSLRTTLTVFPGTFCKKCKVLSFAFSTVGVRRYVQVLSLQW